MFQLDINHMLQISFILTFGLYGYWYLVADCKTTAY